MEPQRGEPATPTGTVTATPAAAPAPASSSTVQDDFKSKVKTANSPLALRALIDEMKATTPKPGAKAPAAPTPAPQEPEAAPVEATPEAQPAEAAAPEGGEATPAPEVTEPETPEQQPVEPEIEDDGGEGPIVPVQGKRAHLRLAEDDQVGRLAASYMKRNRDMPMAEALERAQKQLGITPQKSDAQPEATPAVPALPQTVEATQSAYEHTLAEFRKAMSEVRFEDAADLNAKLMQLTLHRSTLERKAEQEQVQQEQQYTERFQSSVAKAAELYPFAADPASPGGKRMLEIDADLKANDDPLYYSPDRPLKIAQMVATEMNIAPKKKGVPAPATPAAPAAATPKKGIVPQGSSRTVPPAPKPAVDPEISSIKTMADLRKQLSKAGVRV